MATSSLTLKQKAYHEMKEFLLITLYLWVVFVLFEVHKSVILAENHLNVASQSFAVINALALAKVILIAKQFHFADVVHNVPLIYPTLLQSAAFTFVLACFKILEDSAIGLYRGQSFQQSLADIGGGTWKGILSLSAIMFVVLIPFFAFTELQGILGEGKLEQVFLHRHEILSGPDRSAGAGGRVLE